MEIWTCNASAFIGLFIVGFTSLIGVFLNYRQELLRVKTALCKEIKNRLWVVCVGNGYFYIDKRTFIIELNNNEYDRID